MSVADAAPASESELPGSPQAAEVGVWLNDAELAVRLAGFLWQGPPDEPLLILAAHRELHRGEVLRAQTTRLLADPRARQFVNASLEHWLQLGSARPAAADLDEARSSFARLIRENLGLETLLASSGPLVKERLTVRLEATRAKEGQTASTRLTRDLVQHWIAFARGAPLRDEDGPAVEDILARGKVDRYGLRTLLHEIVQSELFQTR